MNEIIVGGGDLDLATTLAAIASTMTQLSQQLSADKQEQKGVLAEIRQDVSDFKADVRNEIDGVKDSQYIEPWQAAKVQEAAKSRVYQILKEWCDDHGSDIDIAYHRYYGKFVRLVHNDAKKAGLEIGKIIYTPRRNYAMLLEFIGKWIPMRGVGGQMEYYDKLAAM